MPTNCCVYRCRTTKKAGDGISLHSFPDRERSPTRFMAWVKQINRKNFNPSKYLKVCSRHFKEQDYEPSSSLKKKLLTDYKGPRTLLPTAVPTIALRGESEERVVKDMAREREKTVEEGLNYIHAGASDHNFTLENSRDQILKFVEMVREDGLVPNTMECEIIVDGTESRSASEIQIGMFEVVEREASLDHVRTRPNEHDTIRSNRVQSDSDRAGVKLLRPASQMAVPTPTPFLNKVKLIRAVAERRILWDQKSEHYFNRDLSKVAWDHVAREVGTTSEICKKKWRGLRDTFIKEYRKMQKENNKVCNWRYFNKLLFLTDQIKLYKSHGSETADQFEATLSQEEYTQLMNERHDDGEIKPYSEIMLVEEDVKREATTEDEDNSLLEDGYEPEPKKSKTEQEVMDSDYHFLMSLLPTMRLLPQKRKNVVRLKILNILCEEDGTES